MYAKSKIFLWTVNKEDHIWRGKVKWLPILS